ncbi:MAG: hypothetical protein KC620_06080 [Myxococcales bacterium]|nr:hypothetical protein [Myxococcales bacterium]
MRRWTWAVGPLWLAAALFAGCDDDEAAVVDAAQQADVGPDTAVDMPDAGPADAAPPVEQPACDPLDPGSCTLPWPSNLYLVEDDSRATGYALRFADTALPASLATGNPVSPALFSHLDGYGLGTPIMALFPDLDPTQLPDETAIPDSLAEDAAAVLLEVTGDGVRRVPWFVDLDAQAAPGSQRATLLRPAEVLKPATRYVVGFRGLRTEGGAAIMPSEAFAALRDGATDDPALAARQPRFDEVFALLEGAGFARGDLTLAWDFVTASSDALTGRMRSMRDQAFETVGEDGPELVIDEINEYLPADDGSGAPWNPYVALRYKGHFRAPHYMKLDEVYQEKQGYVFNLDEDGRPAQNGWREDVTFYVSVPHGALDGTPHGLIHHGHGMFGDGRDAADLGWTRLCGKYPPRECGWYHGRVDQNHQFITFAGDLKGMSQEDRDEYALTILTDINKFPWITDRLHQGMLEYLLLQRAMMRRFGSLPEVADRGIVINPDENYYWGISQGAIFGSTFLALSDDVHRGVLSVAGVNYATLLDRSRNFEPFFAILAGVYPERIDQLVLMAAMQLLWDGTDGVSYVRHLSADPFPGQSPTQVLVDVARGDYQVAPLTMETVARSGIGLKVLAHYDVDRDVPLVEPVDYPYVGSAMTNWNFGNAWAAPGNVPPEEDPAGDPHENARHMDAMNAQMAHFFRTGEIIDVCAGAPCPDLTDVEGAP